ncbi:VOC family protein [Streptomyces sp. NPDC090442]|uniref:VOC family protein n=1 Tax=Streptomyces sp. NPDC090442 TaxID=3365962 RepID=UPI00382D5339
MNAYVERINVECVDPVRLCAFWSQILSGESAASEGQPVAVTSVGPVAMSFFRRRFAAGTRSCVDIAVDYLELAVVRAVGLGGTPVGGIDRSGERPLQVMKDPEGNVFRFLAR